MKFIAKAMAFIMILAVAVLASLGAASAAQVKHLSNITDDTKLSEQDTTYILDGQKTYNLADKGERGVIIITQNNIILDCNGSTLVGDGTGNGIEVYSVAKGIEIKNCIIKNYNRGINQENPVDPHITDNTLEGNTYGIYFNDLVKNSFLQILRNTGKDNKENFIFIFGRGIQDSVTISENKCTGGKSCVKIYWLETLKINKNEFKKTSEKNVDLINIGKADISENKISDSASNAISIGNIKELTAKNNIGSNNRKFLYVGNAQTKAEIADNSASGSLMTDDAMCIEMIGNGAQGSKLNGNKCSGYSSGIKASGTLTDTEIYSNQLNGLWSAGTGISVSGKTNNTKVYSNAVNDFTTGVLIQPATDEPVTTLVYDNTIKDGKYAGINVKSITQAGTEIYRNTVGGFKNSAILLENSKNLKVYNNTDYYSSILDNTFLNPEKTAAVTAAPIAKGTASTANSMASSQILDLNKEYVLGTAPVPKNYPAGAQPVKQPAAPKTFVEEAGIKLINSESNKIESNTFSYFKYGLYLLSSKSNEILTNTFNKNEYGMFLDSSDSNTIKSNEARLNKEAGLKLKNSKSNTVESNKLTNNSKYGLALEATSTGNTFTSNDLTGNKAAAAYMVDSTTKLTSDADDATNTWTTNIWTSSGAMQTAMVSSKPKTSATAAKSTATVKQMIAKPTAVKPRAITSKQIARRV